MGSAAWRLYITGLLVTVLIVVATTVYFTGRQENSGNEIPVFEVYGFCSPTINSSLICVGSMVNQGASIIPISNITLKIGSYSGKVMLYPSLVLKEYSNVNFEFTLDNTGRYILYSSDGVSRMSWESSTTPLPSITVKPELLLNETHHSYRSNGLIPVEINDYKFISNESGSYFAVIYFQSNSNVSYVDVKLMILHDRLAWEDVVTNIKKEFFIIPFQTALYSAGDSSLLGYPSRITVSFESADEVNVTVRLEVYRTQSAVVTFDAGLESLSDILPILPPHFSETLFNRSPYFLYTTPIPQTVNSPTK